MTLESSKSCLEDVEALMSVSHVVVLSDIHQSTIDWVRRYIELDYRHDGDDVAMLWDPRVCSLVNGGTRMFFDDQPHELSLIHI